MALHALKIAYKNGDSKKFIAILCKKSFIFEIKNNVISINSNYSNNCCLYSSKNKDLVSTKLTKNYFKHLFRSIKLKKKI